MLAVFIGGGAALITGSWQFSIKSRGPENFFPDIEYNSSAPLQNAKSNIRVMTLNLAHGRLNGFHQGVQSTKRIYDNLDVISTVLQRETPDFVALQEADGPSFWSGNFNHVNHLAEITPFSYAVRGHHVESQLLNYGTAVLSQFPISSAMSSSFQPTPPTPAKGFIISTIEHPKLPNGIDIVSVHLDFARESVRKNQITSLIEALSKRDRPCVIMGDFNTNWEKEDTLKELSSTLELTVYEPSGGTVTFPKTNQRLDWIFISKQLKFTSYRVLKDRLSDHRAVIADIQLP